MVTASFADVDKRIAGRMVGTKKHLDPGLGLIYEKLRENVSRKETRVGARKSGER
jgi:hypothetical protein